MDIYNRIQGLASVTEKRRAIKALSDADKRAYTNYQSNLRQKRFMKDANNRDRVYAEKREYKKKQRQQNPEKVRAIVREYVRKFRERLKAQKQLIANLTTLPSLDINDLAARANLRRSTRISARNK